MADTTSLNPAPLNTWTFELSTVSTSPTLYPPPEVKFEIEVIPPVSASTDTAHCAPEPVPVKDIRGILLVPSKS